MLTVLGQTFSLCELARKVGDFSQLFGVELFSHGNGRKLSLRVLSLRTKSGLSFDITVDRAMELAEMSFCGVPIGYQTAVPLQHFTLCDLQPMP
jgi:hypothetical protein